MDKKIKIDDIINKTVKIYKFAKPNAAKIRNIKYQLRMADIYNFVEKDDIQLALNIILDNLQKPRKGILHTAHNKKTNIGFCPRCKSTMRSAKLYDSKIIAYCASCHVAVAN